MPSHVADPTTLQSFIGDLSKMAIKWLSRVTDSPIETPKVLYRRSEVLQTATKGSQKGHTCVICNEFFYLNSVQQITTEAFL